MICTPTLEAILSVDFDYTVCCIKGCDRSSVALGLCVNHWRRNRKYGSPVAIKSHSGQFRGMSAEDRFFAQVKKSDGCWMWRGATDKDGYGIFRGIVAGVQFNRAHRFSYVLHTGDIPQKWQHVCHSCDTPRCVNPAHLWLGSNAENMADKVAKGRQVVPVGENSPHAKISEEQAAAIIADARAYAVIAADYGLSPGTIGNIKSRHSWAHIKGVEVARAPRVSPRKGVSDKITPEIVREIRSSVETGKALAAKFGITPQTVCDIRKRRSWAHIE